jgi:hypothetical protein
MHTDEIHHDMKDREMENNTIETAAVPEAASPAPVAAPAPGFWDWIREGLRAAAGRAPKTGDHQPTPGQMAGMMLLLGLLIGTLSRMEVNGPAEFNMRGWLTPWWSVGAMLLLAWWILSASARRAADKPALSGLASWFALSSVAALPFVVMTLLGTMGLNRGWLVLDSLYVYWSLFLLPMLLYLGVLLALTRRFGVRGRWLTAFACGWVLLSALEVWQFSDRPWWPDMSQEEDADPRPRLVLTQEAFEQQQKVWGEAVAGLDRQRPGLVDVYGVVFAPYASEDVFLKEGRMVSGVLEDRFDAKGRVLHLQNHATTLQTHPWATPLNLERAIQAVAQRMDREQDVLVLYLTSHGASNFRLAAAHWPLEVEWLTPKALREMLDRAGVRQRVIAVSACYSGGWIEPLADEHTLVMTAASAERTSYGCGRKSELTFFGRAVFDEELRKTHSFEQAFAAARPVIDEREKQAGKKDGYSDPQIRVGKEIQPVLRMLEQRLSALTMPTNSTAP